MVMSRSSYISKTCLTLLVFVSTCSLLAAASDPGAEARKAIDAGNAQYIKCHGQSDAAGVAALFEENGARLEQKGRIVRGRKAIQADVETFLKEAGPVTVTVDTVDLWVIDDRAYETGKYTYTFAPPGKGKTSTSGRYVTVWHRQKDGGWLIIADMGVPKD
jgi:uncharacterized protein (TIGR02246 family)